MRVSSVGEFAAIGRLARLVRAAGPGVVAGIGDDAAVLRTAGGGSDLLATADMLIEGVHFDLSYTPPIDLGFKALAVNLSDAAAMGGRPLHYLVSIALPASFEFESLEDIYRGMDEAGRPYKVSLAGGDTVASPMASGGPLVISVTLLGKVKRGKAVLRSGARPGDGLYVTGTLGDSAAGLDILKAGAGGRVLGAGEQNHKLPPRTRITSTNTNVINYLVKRHLRPEARVKAGRLLGESGLASAMIDISDGLASDIRHITGQSGCGAEIIVDALPLSDELLSFAGRKNAVKYALGGGEDYELLFAAGTEAKEALEALAKRAGTPIARIGRITKEAGVFTVDAKGTRKALRARGYEHFRR